MRNYGYFSHLGSVEWHTDKSDSATDDDDDDNDADADKTVRLTLRE